MTTKQAFHDEDGIFADTYEPIALETKAHDPRRSAVRARQKKRLDALKRKHTARTGGGVSVQAELRQQGRTLDAIYAKMRGAVSDLRDTNDRVDRTRAKGRSADGVDNDKLERLNRAISGMERKMRQLSLKAARPSLGGGDRRGVMAPQTRKSALAEYNRQVKSFLRTGHIDGTANPEAALKALGKKASIVANDPSGGFLVFPEQERSILDRILTEMSPMRQLATVRSISAERWTMPYGLGGTTAAWAGETETRAETNTSQLSELEFPAIELYANPKASQQMLEDASIDIEAWIGEEVGIAFGEKESAAFITGSGVKQPQGLLSAPIVANASWAHGSVGYVASGAAGDFVADASFPADKLIDMTYAIKAGFRANAAWLTNRGVVAKMRKFKDTTGQYLWQPPVQAGQPGSFLNYPVYEDEYMPPLAANSYSLAFGDFNRAYIIVDRVGISVLRDPFTAKPYIMFYTRKRVGGGVKNFECFKVMKFASS